MCEIGSVVSLSLTLSIYHTFFWFCHNWLWPSNCWLGKTIWLIFSSLIIIPFSCSEARTFDILMMTMLQCKLAEAINLQDRYSVAQLHETLRSIKQLPRGRSVRLIFSFLSLLFFIYLFFSGTESVSCKIRNGLFRKESRVNENNPFSINVPILYPLKPLENFKFSDVFRGYRSGTLVENGLRTA